MSVTPSSPSRSKPALCDGKHVDMIGKGATVPLFHGPAPGAPPSARPSFGPEASVAVREGDPPAPACDLPWDDEGGAAAICTSFVGREEVPSACRDEASAAACAAAAEAVYTPPGLPISELVAVYRDCAALIDPVLDALCGLSDEDKGAMFTALLRSGFLPKREAASGLMARRAGKEPKWDHQVPASGLRNAMCLVLAKVVEGGEGAPRLRALFTRLLLLGVGIGVTRGDEAEIVRDIQGAVAVRCEKNITGPLLGTLIAIHANPNSSKSWKRLFEVTGCCPRRGGMYPTLLRSVLGSLLQAPGNPALWSLLIQNITEGKANGAASIDRTDCVDSVAGFTEDVVPFTDGATILSARATRLNALAACVPFLRRTTGVVVYGKAQVVEADVEVSAAVERDVAFLRFGEPQTLDGAMTFAGGEDSGAFAARVVELIESLGARHGADPIDSLHETGAASANCPVVPLVDAAPPRPLVVPWVAVQAPPEVIEMSTIHQIATVWATEERTRFDTVHNDEISAKLKGLAGMQVKKRLTARSAPVMLSTSGVLGVPAVMDGVAVRVPVAPGQRRPRGGVPGARRDVSLVASAAAAAEEVVVRVPEAADAVRVPVAPGQRRPRGKKAPPAAALAAISAPLVPRPRLPSPVPEAVVAPVAPQSPDSGDIFGNLLG